MDDFFDDYEENMGIIDEHMGGGGGGATIEEMSLSQYEQLPDTKNSDNIVRALWDVESLGEMALVNIFTPSIYSTTERKIGVWTDNKPLYQKVVAIPNTSVINNSFTFAHGIANIDTPMIVFAFMHLPTTHYSFQIPVISNANEGISMRIDNQYIYFSGTNSFSANVDRTMYVIVQYTKTTDVAGSGSYTTEGVPTQHYSNNETVVGTWTNGKPLYERTIEFNCDDTSNVQTAYTLPNNYFVRTVCDAYFENSANNLSQQFRYTWYKDHFWSYIVNNSGHAISVHRETTDGNWQSGVKFVIIIRYTKTDD